MFKKPTELPPEPKLISGKQICEDLSVPEQDPLYSDAVNKIICVSSSIDSNSKSDNFSPKSFQLIDKILKVKEDMISERELLTKEVDSLCILASDLKKVQERIEKMCEPYREVS